MSIFKPKTWPAPVLNLCKALAVIFVLVIIYSSLTPSGPSPKVLHADKIMHALAYGALTGAARLGWPYVGGGVIIIIASTLGIGLEVAQASLAFGRTGSVYDALANVFGVCAALAVLYPFRK